MEKKYEFTNFSIMYKGHRLHQIRALKNLSNGVCAGDLGGYIEKEENLSHEGTCWVYDNAYVYGNAHIFEDARIKDKAEIFGAAVIQGAAYISNYAKVFDGARISDYAIVDEEAIVCGYAKILNNASISERAIIQDNAVIRDSSLVQGTTLVRDLARVDGYSRVQDNIILKDCAVITNSYLEGNICINNENHITNAVMFKNSLEEQIRCQTGLIPINGEVIAYKIVHSDLTSFFDKTFQYEIGEWAIAKEVDESENSCSEGLHFSNATYWDKSVRRNENCETTYLIAKIRLEDIVTVQKGKIRCRKAFILGRYDIKKD